MVSLDTRNMTIGSNLRPTFATRLQSCGLAFSPYPVPTQCLGWICVSWLSHQPRTDVRPLDSFLGPTREASHSIRRPHGPWGQRPWGPHLSTDDEAFFPVRWLGWDWGRWAGLRPHPYPLPSPLRFDGAITFRTRLFDWIECRKELWVPLFWGTDVSLYMYLVCLPWSNYSCLRILFLLLFSFPSLLPSDRQISSVTRWSPGRPIWLVRASSIFSSIGDFFRILHFVWDWFGRQRWDRKRIRACAVRFEEHRPCLRCSEKPSTLERPPSPPLSPPSMADVVPIVWSSCIISGIVAVVLANVCFPGVSPPRHPLGLRISSRFVSPPFLFSSNSRLEIFLDPILTCFESPSASYASCCCRRWRLRKYWTRYWFCC